MLVLLSPLLQVDASVAMRSNLNSIVNAEEADLILTSAEAAAALLGEDDDDDAGVSAAAAATGPSEPAPLPADGIAVDSAPSPRLGSTASPNAGSADEATLSKVCACILSLLAPRAPSSILFPVSLSPCSFAFCDLCGISLELTSLTAAWHTPLRQRRLKHSLATRHQLSALSAVALTLQCLQWHLLVESGRVNQRCWVSQVFRCVSRGAIVGRSRQRMLYLILWSETHCIT
jgi:hypothetical protein